MVSKKGPILNNNTYCVMTEHKAEKYNWYKFKIDKWLSKIIASYLKSLPSFKKRIERRGMRKYTSPILSEIGSISKKIYLSCKNNGKRIFIKIIVGKYPKAVLDLQTGRFTISKKEHYVPTYDYFWDGTYMNLASNSECDDEPEKHWLNLNSLTIDTTDKRFNEIRSLCDVYTRKYLVVPIIKVHGPIFKIKERCGPFNKGDIVETQKIKNKEQLLITGYQKNKNKKDVVERSCLVPYNYKFKDIPTCFDGVTLYLLVLVIREKCGKKMRSCYKKNGEPHNIIGLVSSLPKDIIKIIIKNVVLDKKSIYYWTRPDGPHDYNDENAEESEN